MGLAQAGQINAEAIAAQSRCRQAAPYRRHHLVSERYLKIELLLLEWGEGDRECSSSSADPKDSSALRGVDTFMVNLAEYLQSPDTAESATNHDESKPSPTQNASAENESLSSAVRESSSFNGPESLQTEPGGDDNVAGAPANLHGAASIVPSPARSTQDAGRPVSFLEPDAKTEEDNNQSDRYQHGPASAADEGRSDTDIQREQIASGMNPLDVKLDSAHDAVKNEIQDTEDTVQN